MEFDGFDWDEGNCDKCRKHGLALDEIEGLFGRSILILPDPGSAKERRWRAIVTAMSGRKVFVVFTLRDGAVRPISARYMHKREVANYEKAYPDLRER